MEVAKAIEDEVLKKELPVGIFETREFLNIFIFSI